MLNWYFGWTSILLAFVTGAFIGLFFHQENWLGGYQSFQRRILRLGHIAQAALGMLNVVSGNFQVLSGVSPGWVGQWALVIGGITMPAVCFLSAWKKNFRHLFFVPVTALIVAAVEILRTGPA